MDTELQDSFRNKETVDKQWLVIDAEGQPVGRLSSVIAALLRGKHKVNYTPHVDCGDNVIVINAEKVALTGNKWDDKEYVRFSGYPGGQRFRTAKEAIALKPTFVVEKAVKGMLPHTKLGNAIFKNLHVFAGAEHTHEAQKPTTYTIN